MGTYMIPRDTKGEGRLLFIFTTKSLIFTVIGGVIGIPFYYLFKVLGISSIGIVIVAVLALIGFIIATIKIPNIQSIKITRDIGGENIEEIILRYIKFKMKKNRIYTINYKEETKDE